MRQNSAVSQNGFFAFIIKENGGRCSIYGVVLRELPAVGKIVNLKGDDHDGTYRIAKAEKYQTKEIYFHIALEKIEERKPGETLDEGGLVSVLCR